MQNKIKELELDLNELMFLLDESTKRPEFVAIARRHISRLIGSLEELQSDLDQIQNSDPTNRKAAPPSCEEESVTNEITPEVSVTVRVEEPSNAVVSPVAVLGEQLKPSIELVRSISLNDTFRFSRELFDGDTEKMNRALQEITRMSILADVISYLATQTMWDEEKEATKDFIELLKKYFV